MKASCINFPPQMTDFCLPLLSTGDQETRSDRHLPALHLQLRGWRGRSGQGRWQHFRQPGEGHWQVQGFAIFWRVVDKENKCPMSKCPVICLVCHPMLPPSCRVTRTWTYAEWPSLVGGITLEAALLAGRCKFNCFGYSSAHMAVGYLHRKTFDKKSLWSLILPVRLVL